jgi:protocatechuate 3,4-dioxygenase beta subunit
VLAASLGAPAIVLQHRTAWAQTRTPLPRTPSQTEGPFYPVVEPADSDADLLRYGDLSYTKGQACWMEGAVLDLEGRPVGGALVEIWQCDAAGNYRHPGNRGEVAREFQGFGRVQVGADGRYRFRTLKPAPYSGRTPHIHVKVKLARRELLTTQMYVLGDAGNERDFLWRNLGAEQRAALTRSFTQGSDGLRVEFPIVVAA